LNILDNRKSGILMHITCLPGNGGIGTLGKNAFLFIDFLKASGQTYWQILPLGSTGYGDSPYQSFSAFDGNPYLIDLDDLAHSGFLTQQEIKNADLGTNPSQINYSKIFTNKMQILRLAFSRAKLKIHTELETFKSKNKSWIEDYTLFMALKNRFDYKSWLYWDDDIRLRKKNALNNYIKKLESEIEFWLFTQYIFERQWIKVKEYANKSNIYIIGDIPIYVSLDSSDIWVNHNLFCLDKNRFPLHVAGCPPDGFSENGQLWGNPIYNWKYMEKRGFKWWIQRIKSNLKLYDILRIDHFRGFESFWQVPYGHSTAKNGEWIKGPGIRIFKALEKKMGKLPIIAEDLGFVTDEVYSLRKEAGFPGMKVLLFAFDTREESDYLPHNYHKNCIVYTGTHDNDTVTGWLRQSGKKEDIKKAVEYFKLNRFEGYHWGFIRGAWSSIANTAIAPIQDFLGLDSRARMNIPSTIGNNWRWRLKNRYITKKLASKILKITELYSRL
jgi:4-alpha-glucanotransferase